MPDKKTSIFLSYSRADKDFALKLAQDLRIAGASLWVDQLDIEPGQPWDRSVEQALKQSPILLVIISSASIQSENVLDEIGFAIDTKKRIVPILHEKCDLPFRIRRLQYVDFTQGYDQGMARCLAVLSSERSANDSPSGTAAIGISQDDRKIAQEAKGIEANVRQPREHAAHEQSHRSTEYSHVEADRNHGTRESTRKSRLARSLIIAVPILLILVFVAVWIFQSNSRMTPTHPTFRKDDRDASQALPKSTEPSETITSAPSAITQPPMPKSTPEPAPKPAPSPPNPAPKVPDSRLSNYKIDVFWCTTEGQEQANKIRRSIDSQFEPARKGSVRRLTYGGDGPWASGYEVRVDPNGSEDNAGKILAQYLNSRFPSNRFSVWRTADPTPSYLSVFVCPGAPDMAELKDRERVF